MPVKCILLQADGENGDMRSLLFIFTSFHILQSLLSCPSRERAAASWQRTLFLERAPLLVNVMYNVELIPKKDFSPFSPVLPAGNNCFHKCNTFYLQTPTTKTNFPKSIFCSDKAKNECLFGLLFVACILTNQPTNGSLPPVIVLVDSYIPYRSSVSNSSDFLQYIYGTYMHRNNCGDIENIRHST